MTFLCTDVSYNPGDTFFMLQSHRVEFHKLHDSPLSGIDDDGTVFPMLRVHFKLERGTRDIYRQITDDLIIFRPDLTAYELMIKMTEAGSEEKGNYSVGFWDHAEKRQGSKSYLRRMINEGGIRFNGRILKHDQVIDFPIFSIVAFPKSDIHYTTFW